MSAGRVAVVTGAGRGIGRAVAQAFARDGAKVVLAGRDVDALEQTALLLDGESLVIPTDVTRDDDVERLAARTLERFGTIDVLCANSGIAGPTAELWQVDPSDWEQTFAVNVTGTFRCARAVLPTMIDRGRGSVVVIGSSTGKKPLPGRTPYAASKTALIGLTRTLALEAGGYGVRVNLVSPGPVAGPRLDAVLDAQARAAGEPVEVVRDRMLAGLALRRFVEADDVASAVVYLASDAAAAITGQDLNVAAGGVMY